MVTPDMSVASSSETSKENPPCWVYSSISFTNCCIQLEFLFFIFPHQMSAGRHLLLYHNVHICFSILLVEPFALATYKIGATRQTDDQRAWLLETNESQLTYLHHLASVISIKYLNYCCSLPSSEFPFLLLTIRGASTCMVWNLQATCVLMLVHCQKSVLSQALGLYELGWQGQESHHA